MGSHGPAYSRRTISSLRYQHMENTGGFLNLNAPVLHTVILNVYCFKQFWYLKLKDVKIAQTLYLPLTGLMHFVWAHLISTDFSASDILVARGLRVKIFTWRTKAPNFSLWFGWVIVINFRRDAQSYQLLVVAILDFFQNGRPRKWRFLLSIFWSTCDILMILVSNVMFLGSRNLNMVSKWQS